MTGPKAASSARMTLTALAAFCTYFCMYAFRKPFSAGTFEDQELFGWDLKALLVISQIAGYLLSKFAGIKIISEMRRQYRAVAILGLIGFAELALVGFAFVPLPAKPFMLFLNGLPLGMVFGLVLAYLEGRQQTEALSAALCASFIMSSGFVKSVGVWLVQTHGFSEFLMPCLVGLIFVPALLLSVWLLELTPAPAEEDIRTRAERRPMDGAARRKFWSTYWPGLTLFVAVYIALTIVRTARDDFGVEIWQDMGVDEKPTIFARTEAVVAVCVAAVIACTIWITRNLVAIRVTIALMGAGFLCVAGSALLQSMNSISPFVFMVMCGIGLYIPYVAFHTTVFERLIATSRQHCNLGFLMYVADSLGYMGYTLVIVLHHSISETPEVLPFFRLALWVVAIFSMISLSLAMFYFHLKFSKDEAVTE